MRKPKKNTPKKPKVQDIILGRKNLPDGREVFTLSLKIQGKVKDPWFIGADKADTLDEYVDMLKKIDRKMLNWKIVAQLQPEQLQSKH